MFARLILVGIATVASPGCAHTQNTSDPGPNSQLTHGNVQINLQTGKTSQAEVLEKFGPPNIATIDGSGNELWTYQRHATVQQSSSVNNYWTIVLFGISTRTSGFEQSQRTASYLLLGFRCSSRSFVVCRF